MEYLTLLDYLYVITAPERKRVQAKAKQLALNTSAKLTSETAFFLRGNLTLLNRLRSLKHHHPAH